MARATNNSNLPSALAVILALLMATATYAQEDILNPAAVLVDAAAGAAEQQHLLVVPETADVAAAVPSAAAQAAIRPEVAATTGELAMIAFRHVIPVPCMGLWCSAAQARVASLAWRNHACVLLQLQLRSTAVWCLARVYLQAFQAFHCPTWPGVSVCVFLLPPTVLLRRTSRREAAAALRKAQPWRPLLQPKPASALNSTASVDPQAICGTNSLVADNSFTNCRIVTTYSNGVSTSCSASKIASNILATAGRYCA